MQYVLTKPALPRYTIRVGASLAIVEGDVATLSRLMVAAGVVILFVAPLSGYWLAGRATRPLAHIITTAARLRPSHMEERLPIRGTLDELDQLSATINRFLDLLGDYLERNREFVANAAHELRSPLAAVQSSVEVTLNSDRTVEEYQDLLAEIADQCGQLRVLVNQLLAAGRNRRPLAAGKAPGAVRPPGRKVGRHVSRCCRRARHPTVLRNGVAPRCSTAMAIACARSSTT